MRSRRARATGSVMPAASLDAMSAVSIDADRPWTEPTRTAFLELLRCGPAAVDALETLDRIGLLERYVPAWGPVRCRPQRDPYHRSSVDVHLLATLAGVARLLEDPGDDPSVALRGPGGPGRRRAAARRAPARHRQDRAGAPRRDRDAGGARDARARGRVRPDGRPRAVPRRGAPAPVGHGDPSRSRRRAVDRRRGRSCRRPGSPGGAVPPDDRRRRGDGSARVDAVARGPGPRARRQGPARPRTRRRGFGYRRAADGAGGGDPRGAGGRGRRGGRTLLAADAARLRPDGPDRPRADPPPPARPGRGLARGAHARHRGLARGRLRARGRRRGPARVALDDRRAPSRSRGCRSSPPRCSRRTTASPSTCSRSRGCSSPRSARSDGASSARRCARRSRAGSRSTTASARSGAHYPDSPTGVPVRVEVDNEASDFFTVIEVGAPDRIGLLFDITRTFAELQLDVHLAKVATFGGRVVDAFYVRDELGRRVDDLESVAELEDALRGPASRADLEPASSRARRARASPGDGRPSACCGPRPRA